MADDIAAVDLEKPDFGDDLPTPAVEDTPAVVDDTPAVAEDADPKPAADDEKLKKEKNIHIPKERFDAAVKKEREKTAAALARIKTLELAQSAQRDDYDLNENVKKLEELQNSYEEALLKGEKDEARKFRQEANAISTSITEFKTIKAADRARTSAVETVNFETTLAQIEEKYPQLNPDSEDVNEALVTEVADLMQAFMSKGESRAAALRKAVRYVIRDTEAPAAVAEVADPAVALAAAKQKQGETAREKAAQAAKGTPPIVKPVNTTEKEDSGIPQVSTLSYNAFKKLDEETKSKMRGDTI